MTEWWDTIRQVLAEAIEHHGLLAGFCLILIEEIGVPVPVPGDFLMLGLGVHAREGGLSLWQALLAMEVATLIGASVLYVVARRAGRDMVYRYGHYIHLTRARLDRAESWLARHGALAIMAGRLTPGLRMATVIACGVFGVPFWRFLPSLAVGGFAYILLYTLLGYFFGPPIMTALEGIHLPLSLFGSLLPLGVLSWWIMRARRGLHLRQATDAGSADRRHRWRDGAVAGGLATLISALAMNVVVHVLGNLALVDPGNLVERMQARLAVVAIVRGLGPVLLLAGTPAFILIGVFWGAVYAQWVEPRLHVADWVAGLCFALLPLCLALVVGLPVLDSAVPAAGPLGPLAAASETLRHALYGIALGASYPLRLARLPQALQRNTVRAGSTRYEPAAIG